MYMSESAKTIADALRWKRLMELCGKHEDGDYSVVKFMQDSTNQQYLLVVDNEKVIPGDSFDMCMDNARFVRIKGIKT